jgi:hypothetical protein
MVGGCSSAKLTEFMTKIAVSRRIPLWMMEELVPERLSLDQEQRIKNSYTLLGEKRALLSFFPEEANKINYAYKKALRFEDPSRPKNLLRTNLTCNLEKNDVVVGSLTSSMMEFVLGYTIKEYVAHIEAQFDSNMNWANQGGYWHLDHIKPCAILKYKSVHDDNFRELWALKNLRPLEKMANIKKGSKFVVQDKGITDEC